MLMSKFPKASLFIPIVNKGVMLRYIKLLSISLLILIPVQKLYIARAIKIIVIRPTQQALEFNGGCGQ